MEVKIHKCNSDNNTSYLWHSLFNKALSNILPYLILPQCFGKKGVGLQIGLDISQFSIAV